MYNTSNKSGLTKADKQTIPDNFRNRACEWQITICIIHISLILFVLFCYHLYINIFVKIKQYLIKQKDKYEYQKVNEILKALP